MEAAMHHDEAHRQLSELEHQLRMFSKIKDLYNVDFGLEVRKCEKRIDQIRTAIQHRDQIRHA